MRNLHRQSLIGIVAIVASVFLIVVAIPGWVSSPSNVSNIILSPLFWPYTLAGLTGLVGIGMVLTGRHSREDIGEQGTAPAGGFFRLAAMAAVMVIYMYLLPRLGMVWASMLAFAATAYIVRCSNPRIAAVAAVVVPLLLYAFFAHVAGVAIPQGELVRLP